MNNRSFWSHAIKVKEKELQIYRPLLYRDFNMHVTDGAFLCAARVDMCWASPMRTSVKPE